MDGLTDQQLLRDYAERKSEAAFAELGRRYVDLVYSAALRMVSDSHAAKDVTQEVFVALAANARQLAHHPVLAGWLHQTTRNFAANSIRTSTRRSAREQEAATMNEILASQAEAGWEQIAPQLDDALHELSKEDRDALLLRYFQRKSAQEMASSLGISSEAAQKRVNRAVERLRETFAKRGVAIGAGGLVVALSANAVHAAPIGLVASIANAVFAGAAKTSAIATTTKIIAMTTLQKTLVAAVVAVAVGAGIFEARQNSSLRDRVEQLQNEQTDREAQWAKERNKTQLTLAAFAKENERLKSGQNSGEVRKLRSQVGQLKEQAANVSKSNSSSGALANYWKDPNSRKLARVQTEQALRMKFAPLGQQLNLSAEAMDKFVNLLVDSEMKKKDLLVQATTEKWDGDTAVQSRDDERANLQNQLTDLLGQAGYSQFQEFKQQIGAEEYVRTLSQQLGENPLNDTQRQQLQALYAVQPEMVMDNMDLFRSTDSLNALFQSIVERENGVLQNAAGFLAPQQLSAFGAAQSNYFASIRTQMNLAQQLINKPTK